MFWLGARGDEGWVAVWQLLSLAVIDPVGVIASVFGAAGGE